MVAVALIGIGVIGAAVASDEADAPRQTATERARTTTSSRTQVLGVQIDNTTTTVAVSTVTTAPVTTSTSTSTSTSTAARNGRIYGYSFPSEPDDETTVTLSRDGAVIAERKTDAEGAYEFRDVPAGTYVLYRTTRTPTASSRSSDTEVKLPPGGEARADVF